VRHSPSFTYTLTPTPWSNINLCFIFQTIAIYLVNEWWKDPKIFGNEHDRERKIPEKHNEMIRFENSKRWKKVNKKIIHIRISHISSVVYCRREKEKNKKRYVSESYHNDISFYKIETIRVSMNESILPFLFKIYLQSK
jgi:hypothetical protein